MLGLCHRCLSSGTEVKVTKGFVHCSQCPPQPIPEVDIDYAMPLPFEDLPQGNPETIHLHAYKILSNMEERDLIKKMALDRLLDKD